MKGLHPTQQDLLHRRLQGDNGTDEAFYSLDEPLVLHRSPGSPDIRCVCVCLCVFVYM